MRIVHVPLEARSTPGEWVASVDVLIRRPGELRSTRHLIHFTDERGMTRLEPGGPMVPGPCAFAMARSVAPVPEPKTRKVDPGDALDIGGHLFVVEETPADPVTLRVASALEVATSSRP